MLKLKMRSILIDIPYWMDRYAFLKNEIDIPYSKDRYALLKNEIFI